MFKIKNKRCKRYLFINFLFIISNKMFIISNKTFIIFNKMFKISNKMFIISNKMFPIFKMISVLLYNEQKDRPVSLQELQKVASKKCLCL